MNQSGERAIPNLRRAEVRMRVRSMQRRRRRRDGVAGTKTDTCSRLKKITARRFEIIKSVDDMIAVAAPDRETATYVIR